MTPWMDADFIKRFPGISINGQFTWQDRPRRITALFGPSGCGKTTILRCLAGLEQPDEGHIRVFGEEWCDVPRWVHVSPQRRRVGFLFQEYMLFPHLSVWDNIGFGATVNASRRSRIEELVRRFQLTGLERRFPRQLSGGQQQRVALARALAAQPRLLCLDEPLSAVDGPTRIDLGIALRDWLHEAQLPALIVSHDAVEVQSLADDVTVLHDGQICQAGSVAEVWRQPVDAVVARIVGFDNFIPVIILGGDSKTLQVSHGDWRLKGMTRLQAAQGFEATACIRADDIRCVPVIASQTIPATRVVATIQEVIPEGGRSRLRLKLASGERLQSVIPREAAAVLTLQPGATVGVEVAAEAPVIVARAE